MNSYRSSPASDQDETRRLEPPDEPPDSGAGAALDPRYPAPEASISPAVNYDEDALVEVGVGEIDYRLDSGKAGTALCISRRETGTWRWSFLGEAKWDGSTLRCRALERAVLEQVALELREVSAGYG
jgi:hypothetical protein